MIEATKQVIDRFDLEQQIMECWRAIDDMKIVAGMVSSSSPDDVVNALTGMSVLYDQKFIKLFDTFETLIAHRKIS